MQMCWPGESLNLYIELPYNLLPVTKNARHKPGIYIFIIIQSLINRLKTHIQAFGRMG